MEGLVLVVELYDLVLVGEDEVVLVAVGLVEFKADGEVLEKLLQLHLLYEDEIVAYFVDLVDEDLLQLVLLLHQILPYHDCQEVLAW